MPWSEFQSVTEQMPKVVVSVVPAFAKFISRRHDDFHKYRQWELHIDLTKPQEWYPHACLDKQKIVFHAGQTNSGKTYNSLQHLKQAKKGMYLAPLCLLAAEIYEHLNAEGIYIDLLIGELLIYIIFPGCPGSLILSLSNLELVKSVERFSYLLIAL